MTRVELREWTRSLNVPVPPFLQRVGSILLRNKRPIRDALIIVGIARAVFYYTAQGRKPWTYLGIDARAYWNVDLVHPYAAGVVGDTSAYLYSPAFAQALAPLANLPFPTFYVLWALASYLALAWLVRPYPWAVLILALPVTAELMTGQVHIFIALAIVLGFQRPGLWALPILTKITPGIGLLWFLVRREWRHLFEAGAVTAAIVAVSFLLSPTAWFDWYDFLRANSGSTEGFLIPRIAIGAALLAFGALTDRRWVVPVVVWFTLPHVWASSWVILLACIRLWPMRGQAPRPAGQPEPAGTGGSAA